MDALIINGPAKLSGTVSVSGSKNSALPFLFASLLFDSDVTFENVPRLWDIETTLSLLREMGCETSWDKEAGKVSVLPKVARKVAPYDWVRKMRAGILALGPLVAKYGEAKVSLPGGCAIGRRPVDYHIEALERMGVKVAVEEGYIRASVLKRITGAEIEFPEVTVTGTENVLTVASVAEGKTVIHNAACEPEVVALGELLRSVGIKIEGLGTRTITVEGGKLQPLHRPVIVPPDRIEAGTWIALAAATRSELTIDRCEPEELTSVIRVFRKMGVKIERLGTDALKVTPNDTYQPVEVETAPYPGFATDMQAQLMVCLCLAKGTSQIVEHIFENRFMHVAELQRMGAKIDVQGKVALIHGPVTLQAAPIMATDLRASACLVIAALSAHGKTKLSRVYHLDRGYQRLDRKLIQLGAAITRVAESVG